MKNFKTTSVVVALFALACFGIPAYAQNDVVFDGVESNPAIETSSQPNSGRPDPTGRGRYIEYGSEVKYLGADILPEGTPGIQCNPASEMVGATAWNATKPEYAIKVVLTDKAEIAQVNGKTYLCKCAKGYNRLFLEEQQAEPLMKTAARVFEGPGLTINVTTTANATLPPYERTTPVAQNYCGNKKNDCDDDGPNWTKRILFGVGVAAAGYAIYHFTRDHPGPGADTNPIKPFCTGTGCPKAPSTGAGFSFSW